MKIFLFLHIIYLKEGNYIFLRDYISNNFIITKGILLYKVNKNFHKYIQ